MPRPAQLASLLPTLTYPTTSPLQIPADRRHERQIEDVTWDWEDGERGEILTIKIPMPNLDRDYDPSESHEIILNRKPCLDNVQMPDWIEIIPPRKPN